MSSTESKITSLGDFCQPDAMASPHAPQLLLVEPDAHLRAAIAANLGSIAVVDAQADFEIARGRLLTSTYDLLASNLRLGEYNGLHLAYLAQQAQASTRAVIYAHERDLGMASDVQRANAFFERLERVIFSLASYVGSPLPPRDRRDPRNLDLEPAAGGGRRLSDQRAAAVEYAAHRFSRAPL